MSVFDYFNMDAITFHPYMGHESLAPFTADPYRGVFVLCLTSNPGSGDFQRLEFDGLPLHLKTAAWSSANNSNKNIGLVVGATHPTDLEEVREKAPDLPFLIPGIGAQGGSLEAAVRVSTETAPAIITVSRGAIYPGQGSLEEIVAAVDNYNKQISDIQAN
jgi:orotidine-5'-phosphate decarboxylase